MKTDAGEAQEVFARPSYPTTAGGRHTFAWHATGRDLLAAKLRCIAAARSSVAMEVFIFRDSAVGRRFRAALTAAAARGVRVRLIVDAVGSAALRRGYFDDLTAAGGAVRRFNGSRPPLVTFRDHRKLLVVDDAVTIVGGCNVAPEYDGDGITTGWRDGGVTVHGPIAAEVAAEFDRQWERTSGRAWAFPPGGVRSPPGPQDGRRAVEALFVKPGLGSNPLRTALRHDLASAGRVDIVCAYFLPSHRLRRELSRTAARGAKVRLLLAGKSDVPLMRLASRSIYRNLLKRGVEIWEYQPQILHAKLVVVDDIVFVGSSNLDPRSLRINFEVMLRIEDAALAAVARGQIESDLADRSVMVADAPRGGGGRARLDDLKQRLAYWFFARLDPELAALKLQRWHRTRRPGGRRRRRLFWWFRRSGTKRRA